METQPINIKDSQNFLHNVGLVNRLVKESSITNNDNVIEIGPGKGIITQALLNKSKFVTAIEFDKKFAENLKSKFDSKTNLLIVNEDFLNFKLPEKEQYKIFSNIPFNLTADILTKILTNTNPPTEMYLIMQYEAFLKYAGFPYCNDSYKSLLFKPKFEFSIVYNFEASDFYPIPNVSIVLAKISLKKFNDIKLAPLTDFWDFLSYIYMAPGNLFKEKTKSIFSYEQYKRIKKFCGINDEDFISQWQYEQWLKMFESYIKFVPEYKKNLVKNSYQKFLIQQSKIEKIHRNR